MGAKPARRSLRLWFAVLALALVIGGCGKGAYMSPEEKASSAAVAKASSTAPAAPALGPSTQARTSSSATPSSTAPVPAHPRKEPAHPRKNPAHPRKSPAHPRKSPAPASGTKSAGAAPPARNDQQAIASCRAGLAALPRLTPLTRRKLEAICRQAASPDAEVKRRAQEEVCRELVLAAPLPRGTSRERALASCSSAAGAKGSNGR